MPEENGQGPLEPLLEMAPGRPLATEWNFYRTQRDRLIAEGHEGRHVLIKGQEVLGVFDTRLAALEAGLDQLGRVDMLIHQVVRKERLIRAGNSWRCRY